MSKISSSSSKSTGATNPTPFQLKEEEEKPHHLGLQNLTTTPQAAQRPHPHPHLQQRRRETRPGNRGPVRLAPIQLPDKEFPQNAPGTMQCDGRETDRFTRAFWVQGKGSTRHGGGGGDACAQGVVWVCDLDVGHSDGWAV